MPNDLSHVTVQIVEFNIVDYFPVRLSAAIGSGLEGSLGSMGVPYYSANDMRDVDSIICSLKGELNDTLFETSYQVPYVLPPFTSMVRKTDEWLNAVKESIRLCAIGAYN